MTALPVPTYAQKCLVEERVVSVVMHAAVVLRGVRVSLVSGTGLLPPIRREMVEGRHAVSIAAAQRTERHINPDLPVFFEHTGACNSTACRLSVRIEVVLCL